MDAKEAWQLTCEDKKGKVRATRNVVVDRGDRVNVGNVCGSGSGYAAAKAAGRSTRRGPPRHGRSDRVPMRASGRFGAGGVGAPRCVD